MVSTGLNAEIAYQRTGPNISAERANEDQLGRHESRYLDQWALFTIVAGPLSFPVTYYIDNLAFPFNRSHFERAAGLIDGNYAVPTDFGPRPLWGPLAAVVALWLLANWSTWRLALRVFRRRRSPDALPEQPQRCLRHTTQRWLRHHHVSPKTAEASVLKTG